MKRGIQTYEQALKKPSEDIWPGCGDGRNMPCGTIHDFSYTAHAGGPLIHSFQCTENHHNGCPQPHPEPKKPETEMPDDAKPCPRCQKSHEGDCDP
ncbi:hypothetical protein LCGC14_3139450, partial [marine sediment metagenome]